MLRLSVLVITLVLILSACQSDPPVQTKSDLTAVLPGTDQAQGVDQAEDTVPASSTASNSAQFELPVLDVDYFFDYYSVAALDDPHLSIEITRMSGLLHPENGKISIHVDLKLKNPAESVSLGFIPVYQSAITGTLRYPSDQTIRLVRLNPANALSLQSEFTITSEDIKKVIDFLISKLSVYPEEMLFGGTFFYSLGNSRQLNRLTFPALPLVVMPEQSQTAYGHPAMMAAVLVGDETALENLIRKGANLNTSDSQKNTLLMLALQSGKLMMARMLIEAGADVNLRNSSGLNALSIALKAKDVGIIMDLLKVGARYINAQDRYGSDFSGIQWAVSDGNYALVDKLIEAGADINEQASFRWDVDKGTHFVSLLQIATLSENMELVDFLLGFDGILNKPNLVRGSILSMMSPLHLAADSGKAHLVRKYLAYGADPNRADDHGFTPLMNAVFFGSLDIVKLLVEAGAEVNYARTVDYSGFVWEEDNPSISGTPLSSRIFYGWKTRYVFEFDALGIAVRNGRIDIVNYLISKGADFTKTYSISRDFKYKLLDLALEHKHESVSELLRQKGLQPLQH